MLMLAAGGALAAWRWRFSPFLYALVAAAFFALHSSRITHTLGAALETFAGAGNQAANASGRVVTEPKIDGSGSATFLFQLHHAAIGENEFRQPATLLVRWQGTPQIGDELELFGAFQSIEPPRNPGEFDLRAYLARRDVSRAFVVRYPEDGHTINGGSRFSVLRAAARARAWMQASVGRGLEDSPDVVGLICGTSLGLRHQTSDDIEEPFQQTGTLHLFAVAGLHVGIVARLLWTVALVLRAPRKIATAFIIPLLFFYATITGLHTASIRAAVMSALLLGGVFFDRKILALNSLAAAAFLILLWDSNQLFSSGFQLSFCVVGAIVLLNEPLRRFFARLAAPDPFLPRILFGRLQNISVKIKEALVSGVSISLAAWLGALVPVYFYFHLVTPISLLANLAVVPIAYFVLALAMLALLSAPFSSALSIIFNNANWLMSQAVLFLVNLFATVPGGHFYLPSFIEKRAPVSITVLDEGTGGAVYLRGENFNWLIDCGGQKNYERTLEAFLHERGVNSLEGILLTHGDAQHIGGANETLLDFTPHAIFNNPLDVRSSIQHRLLKLLRQQPPHSVARGDQLLLDREVRAKILYPPPELEIDSADDAPLIVRLEIGEQTSLLFESDAGAEAEEYLLANPAELRSDVLVKGQHHAGDSGGVDFIAAVQPKLIIATSRDFPAAEKISDEWATEIARAGIKLFRQDETGAVEIQFRDEGWEARAFLTGETFRSSNR